MKIINGTPAFKNDCPHCQFVGRIDWKPDLSANQGFIVGRPESTIDEPFGASLPDAADLYNCYNHHGYNNGNRGAVLRYGNEPEESTSTFEVGHLARLAPELHEALHLAYVTGL